MFFMFKYLSRPCIDADAASSCPYASDRWVCSAMRLYCSTMWSHVDCLKLCYRESTCCWWEWQVCPQWRLNRLQKERKKKFNHREKFSHQVWVEKLVGFSKFCHMHAPHSPHACLVFSSFFSTQPTVVKWANWIERARTMLKMKKIE